MYRLNINMKAISGDLSGDLVRERPPGPRRPPAIDLFLGMGTKGCNRLQEVKGNRYKKNCPIRKEFPSSESMPRMGAKSIRFSKTFYLLR